MNIIDTLKRASEALERASKVMDPEAQAFQDRALADLRSTITEMESAELPDEAVEKRSQRLAWLLPKHPDPLGTGGESAGARGRKKVASG